MNQLNVSETVKNVIKIVLEARKILEKKQKIEIEEKEGIGNIVTQVDLNIEQYIKVGLRDLFPDSQIIAEESSDNIENEKDLKFVVDPLDGSTNYTNGWPHTIAIGIVDKEDLVSGIIYDASTQKIYFSIKGEGVFELDANNIESLAKIIPPQHEKENIKKSIIAHDTPYGLDAFEKTMLMYPELVKKGASTKTVGPISLDILKTALGKENRPTDYNDAVWHMEVRAWDLCAATAILREVGGNIVGDNGKPISIETLTNPSARIAFIASGNDKLRENLYNIYQEKVKTKSKDIELEK